MSVALKWVTAIPILDDINSSQWNNILLLPVKYGTAAIETFVYMDNGTGMVY